MTKSSGNTCNNVKKIMGLLSFLFGNSNQKQSNNSNKSYSDSYERGYEDGYDDCCMNHECDEDCNDDSFCDNYEDDSCYEEHDCGCDYEDIE